MTSGSDDGGDLRERQHELAHRRAARAAARPRSVVTPSLVSVATRRTAPRAMVTTAQTTSADDVAGVAEVALAGGGARRTDAHERSPNTVDQGGSGGPRSTVSRSCSCRPVPGDGGDDAQQEHGAGEQSAVAEDLEQADVARRRRAWIRRRRAASPTTTRNAVPDGGEQRPVDERAQDAPRVLVDDAADAQLAATRQVRMRSIALGQPPQVRQHGEQLVAEHRLLIERPALPSTSSSPWPPDTKRRPGEIDPERAVEGDQRARQDDEVGRQADT